MKKNSSIPKGKGDRKETKHQSDLWNRYTVSKHQAGKMLEGTSAHAEYPWHILIHRHAHKSADKYSWNNTSYKREKNRLIKLFRSALRKSGEL